MRDWHDTVLVLEKDGHKKVPTPHVYRPVLDAGHVEEIRGEYIGAVDALKGCTAMMVRGVDRFNRPIYYIQLDQNVQYKGVNLAGRWHEFLIEDWRVR